MIFNKYPNPIETVFCLSVPRGWDHGRYTGAGLARLAGSWGQLCADQRGDNITVSIGATRANTVNIGATL